MQVSLAVIVVTHLFLQQDHWAMTVRIQSWARWRFPRVLASDWCNVGNVKSHHTSHKSMRKAHATLLSKFQGVANACWRVRWRVWRWWDPAVRRFCRSRSLVWVLMSGWVWAIFEAGWIRSHSAWWRYPRRRQDCIRSELEYTIPEKEGVQQNSSCPSYRLTLSPNIYLLKSEAPGPQNVSALERGSLKRQLS